MEYWAHILWQRHNLRMEDFDAMPRKRKLFYIASELTEGSDPCRRDIFIRGGKKGGGK